MFFLCLAMLRADLWMFEGTGSLAAARGLGLGVAVLAVPVTVLGAVPAIAWLITRDRLSLRRLVRWGCLIGNAPYAIIVVSVFAVQLTRGTRFSEVVQWFGWFGTNSCDRARCRVRHGDGHSMVGDSRAAGQSLHRWLSATRPPVYFIGE
jgi:hypothetical protein